MNNLQHGLGSRGDYDQMVKAAGTAPKNPTDVSTHLDQVIESKIKTGLGEAQKNNPAGAEMAWVPAGSKNTISTIRQAVVSFFERLIPQRPPTRPLDASMQGGRIEEPKLTKQEKVLEAKVDAFLKKYSQEIDKDLSKEDKMQRVEARLKCKSDLIEMLVLVEKGVKLQGHEKNECREQIVNKLNDLDVKHDQSITFIEAVGRMVQKHQKSVAS